MNRMASRLAIALLACIVWYIGARALFVPVKAIGTWYAYQTVGRFQSTERNLGL